MSGINTSDILSAITEAQGALNREPEYKTRITNYEGQLKSARDHILGLELNIVGYKADIKDLQAKVRSLEVERDDAGFRVLELDERLAAVLSLVQGSASGLASVIKLLSPPKPLIASAASEAEPTEAQHVNITETAQGDTSMPVNASVDNVPAGQSAADPTHSNTAASYGEPSANAQAQPVEVRESVSAKPYEGKNWSEVTPRCNYNEWKQGGGSEYGWQR